MFKKIYILFLICLLFSNYGFAQNWVAKGQTDFFKKRYESAIRNFNRAIEAGDSSFDVFYYRGLSYLYSENFDSALKDLNIAVGKENRFPDVYNSRGLAYLYLGELKLALDDFTSAINLDSNFAEAYSNRASVFIEIGEIEPAIQDLEKSIKLNPKSPLSFYEKGRALYKMKKYVEAVQDFDKSIELGLKNSKVYYNRGNAFFKLEKYQLAIKDYTRCIELDSLDTEALNNRAVAYDKIGKKKLADKDRARIAKISGTENLFVPPEKIIYRDFKDSLGTFSLKVPNNWYIFEKNYLDYNEIIITPEKIQSDSDYYNVGIKLSFNKNMFQHYQVKSADEIIDFWMGSLAKTSKDYNYYQYLQQKIFNRDSYIGRLVETIVQISPNMPTLHFYELAFAKEDALLFAFFQSPANQFAFFREIFDKIIESIQLLN